MRSRDCGPGGPHLKSWVVEVSHDMYLWRQIDRRDDNNDLNGALVTANFTIPSVPIEVFRFFRLKQLKNHAGNGFLTLSALEIIGTCQPKPSLLDDPYYAHLQEKPSDHPEEFVYDASNKLNGMIAWFQKNDRKGFDVTASSVQGRVCVPRNVTDGDKESYYCSMNEEHSWICYAFTEVRVKPTSYSVMSYGLDTGYCHLKSWVIEVSNDRESWTEIDHRDNNNDLNGSCVTVNFKISRVPSEGFRFFRLRQTGKNHRGDYRLTIGSLEIFGTLC